MRGCELRHVYSVCMVRSVCARYETQEWYVGALEIGTHSICAQSKVS